MPQRVPDAFETPTSPHPIRPYGLDGEWIQKVALKAVEELRGLYRALNTATFRGGEMLE